MRGAIRCHLLEFPERNLLYATQESDTSETLDSLTNHYLATHKGLKAPLIHYPWNPFRTV